MKALAAKYLGVALLVLAAVVVVSWWQDSTADARLRELEKQAVEVRKRSEEERRASEAALKRYEQLTADHARSEEQRSRQLSLLIAQLQGLQADNSRLRGELTRKVEDTKRRVDQVSGTPDAQLADQVQADLRTVKPAAGFTWNMDGFLADRPAAEAIRENFLRLELADYTVGNQAKRIEALEDVGANLQGQLGLARAAGAECAERESACAESLEAVRTRSDSLQELLRLREEQVAALKRKTWWRRFKKWGGLSLAFGAGYATAKATESAR